MKKLIIICFFMAITFTIKAQNIPYEKLDSISASISKLQLEANNLVYNDGKDDYVLSFPEANFEILYSTGKAQKVVIKKKDDTEYLYLTENIDLTKASEIYPCLYPGRAGALRMAFPEGVKTQVYENGTYTKTITEYYLEFFYDRDESLTPDANGNRYLSGSILLVSLGSMVAFFKLENNLPALDFLYQGRNISFEKYGPNLRRDYITYVNSIQSKLKPYNDLAFSAGSKGGISHSLAASYYEEGIAIKIPFNIKLSTMYGNLLYHLNGAKKYSKMGEILNSPDIYFKDLTETDLIHYKSEYLQGIGKCLEAEKLLLETYNSPNSSKSLKREIKVYLFFLYKYGCKGKDSNKVKKNKALSNQYNN